MATHQMDKLLATIDIIIDKYEKSRIRLPNPSIKIAVANFKKASSTTRITAVSDYFTEYKHKLLVNMPEFLSMANSAIAIDKTSYIPISSFYRLASELASDITKTMDLSKLSKLQQYTEYPDLKLPIGYQLNLWRTILEALPESDSDYKTVQGKIVMLEAELAPQTVSTTASNEQVGQIVSSVLDAFQKPKFQDMVQNIMSDIHTGDASQIFGKIFVALQNPEFKEVIEGVVQPMTKK